jgi:hypothetical protein
MRVARIAAALGVLAFAAAMTIAVIGADGTEVSWPWAFGLYLASVLLISNACSYSLGDANRKAAERSSRARARAVPVASIPQGAVRQDASLTGGAGIYGKTPAGGRVVTCAQPGCGAWFLWRTAAGAAALGWTPDEAFAGAYAWLVEPGDELGRPDGDWWCPADVAGFTERYPS